MRRIAALCLVGLALTFLPGAPASGAPEDDYFLGEPWEASLVRGVEEQRQAERRRVPIDTLVGRAERAVRRDASVTRLYLLARAYGLRAQWHRTEAGEARNAAAKARHLQEADRDRASALATYREVLGRAPRCYFALHDMGILELQRENPDTRVAFDHLSRAYRINGRYTPTQRQLISLYLRRKQHAEAVPLLRRLLQLEPEDDEARLRLVLALTDVGSYEEAYRELEPVFAKDRGQPRGLAMRAHLDLKTGRFDRSIATYKRLARINPNVPTAYAGILDCARLMEERQLEVDLEDVLFALKGLLRIVRDPDDRVKLAEQIKRVEHTIAQPAGTEPGGPPTTAQVLHALESPDESVRIKALIAVMFREETPTNEVLRAVARHIDPAVELSPAVRAGAVRALGRLSGTVLIPLVRLGLRDPEPRVRIETADTLVGIGTRDTGAAGAVIAILGNVTRETDVQVASSARLGILRLAGITLPGLDDESDDAAHRRAFQRWWDAAGGETVQIDALDAYHRVRDREAHQVLVPYLAASSFHVFRAAYRALGRAGATAGTAALKSWHAEMPRFAADRMTKANWNSLKATLDAWVAARPGR